MIRYSEIEIEGYGDIAGSGDIEATGSLNTPTTLASAPSNTLPATSDTTALTTTTTMANPDTGKKGCQFYLQNLCFAVLIHICTHVGWNPLSYFCLMQQMPAELVW